MEDFLHMQYALVGQFQMLILQIVKNVLPELLQDQIINVKFVIEINFRMKVLLNVMIVPMELILQMIILLVLNAQQVLQLIIIEMDAKFVIEGNFHMKALVYVLTVPLELILQMIILLVLNAQQVLK